MKTVKDTSHFAAAEIYVKCRSTTHREWIVVFPLQQWICEFATILRYTYIAYVVT